MARLLLQEMRETAMATGKLVQLDDNLFAIAGFDGRRMTAARLERGELVVYGAFALAGSSMLELDALGDPAYFIVTSDVERPDVRPWKLRYPAIRVIAPVAAKARLGPTVYVDAPWIDLGDPRVELVTLPDELGMRVAGRRGTYVVHNDRIERVGEIAA